MRRRLRPVTEAYPEEHSGAGVRMLLKGDAKEESENSRGMGERECEISLSPLGDFHDTS